MRSETVRRLSYPWRELDSYQRALINALLTAPTVGAAMRSVSVFDWRLRMWMPESAFHAAMQLSLSGVLGPDRAARIRDQLYRYVMSEPLEMVCDIGPDADSNLRQPFGLEEP